ncbi:MAG TPA: GreA/GreB family elongation factor [Novosphingobium sp.]|jgi:transcription elongation GreA/GreB family factor|nr:GreA/GreB family elongation factor [Novosphingobium sp.]
MSVAFRRDGDDEHLEPKFEIPIPPGPNLVTARGKALIDEKVTALETAIASAEPQRVEALKRELRYWQTRQVTAEVVPAPSGDTVEIGTTVSLRLNGKARVLSIVGDDEGDPGAGLVAFSSPLARALMGAEVGEMVDWAGTEGAIEVQAITAAA